MKLPKEVRKVSKELFQASFAGGQLDDGKIRGFVQQVIAGKPRHYVAILKAYQRLIRLEIEKHHATIESAVELDSGNRNRIIADLRAKYGHGLTTEFRVEPSLLAGLRVRVGNDVWDGSVRARLDALQQSLAA